MPASGSEGQCMITGEVGPIVDRMIGSVRGLPGAVSTGAKLMSFNRSAFTSYGLTGMENAPLSPAAARAIDVGLTDLLGRFENRLLVGETVYLFWASGDGPGDSSGGSGDGMDFSAAGALLVSLVGFPMGERAFELVRRALGERRPGEGSQDPEREEADGRAPDEMYVLAASLLRGAAAGFSGNGPGGASDGEITGGGVSGLKTGTLNALALRAQAGRVAVRSFLWAPGPRMLFAAAAFVLAQRLPDLRSPEPVAPPLPPRGAGALVAAALLDGTEASNHPRLTDSLIRSALLSEPVGEEIEGHLARRSQTAGLSVVGAQLAKLLLVMKGVLEVDDMSAEPTGSAGGSVPGSAAPAVSAGSEDGAGEAYQAPKFEDPEDSHAFYLGRLLALLEEIQRAALGRVVNATVVSRHYGLAVSSPEIGFSSPLTRANRAHLPTLRRKRTGLFFFYNEQLDAILAELPKRFPKTLNLQRQLIFGLGYRHQQALSRARARGGVARRQRRAARGEGPAGEDE